MAIEKQGGEQGGEDVRSSAMERFPDGVGDGAGSRSGGGRAFCQRSGNLFCSECGAICERVEDGGERWGRLRREELEVVE